MQTCPKCGTSNRDQAKFCSVCGQRLIPTGAILPVLPASAPPPSPPLPAPEPAAMVGEELMPPTVRELPEVPMPGLTGRLSSNAIIGGRYVVMEKVGQGGMAAVYRVTDTDSPGTVWAIKEMSDAAIPNPSERPSAIRAFRQEADLLRSLSHPNLPVVKDVFTESGKHYLVMEFVEGWTLEEILKHRTEPIGETELVPWALQLCEVLHYLHTQPRPIIFRDLKPGNIMLTPQGQIKLIDFGIVRFFKTGKARDTQIIGTPGYAPPEQHGQGQTDARSDVYSLCATLHQLLTGYDPLSTLFSFPPARTLNPAVSKEVSGILERGLQASRDRRWPSMAELRAALSSVGQPAPTRSGARGPLIPDKTLSPLSQPAAASRPTTRLLMAASALPTWQVALGLAALLPLIAILLWVIVPLLAPLKIYPLENALALVGPLAYAATRRRGMAFSANALVGLVAVGVTRLRLDQPLIWGQLLLGVVVSGLFMEVWLLAVKRARGTHGEEGWRRELLWLALMGVIGEALFYGIYYASAGAVTLLGLLLSAVFAGAGWFLGDLVQQYFLLRRVGLRRW